MRLGYHLRAGGPSAGRCHAAGSLRAVGQALRGAVKRPTGSTGTPTLWDEVRPITTARLKERLQEGAAITRGRAPASASVCLPPVPRKEAPLTDIPH
ncbi:hypothetical protein EYF80_058860 [Liparis tanakae]|uniref:Uncharacterized protein n=1 Tax=Liparis tanakae TaxID=230148 RepID=A0A4Z2EQV3_9TELE|nr:hypothetical protein EYF80_058860 [Liparis tanakae]